MSPIQDERPSVPKSLQDGHETGCDNDSTTSNGNIYSARGHEKSSYRGDSASNPLNAEPVIEERNNGYTPTIIARYAYHTNGSQTSPPPANHDIQYPGLVDPLLTFLSFLISRIVYLVSLLFYNADAKPSTSGCKLERDLSDEEKRVVTVVAMIPYSIVEGGEPLTIPVEIKAKHKRIRELLKAYDIPLAEEGEMGKDIKRAIKTLSEKELRGGNSGAKIAYEER